MKLMKLRAWSIALGVVTGLGVVAVEADDWEQWRGADRLGIWHEDGIIDSFPDSGLTVTWRTPLRSGFSGPATHLPFFETFA